MRLWIFALVAASAACASYRSTSRDAFVHDATCPADRVTVTNAPPEAAPADIAGDPGRLAVWNDEAAKKAESKLVARGCGQEIHYTCQTEYANAGDTQTSFPVCARDDLQLMTRERWQALLRAAH